MSLRDQGSMEGLQFTNITIESLFYERVWWGGAEPIHITAMPRAVNTEASCHSPENLSLSKPIVLALQEAGRHNLGSLSVRSLCGWGWRGKPSACGSRLLGHCSVCISALQRSAVTLLDDQTRAL